MEELKKLTIPELLGRSYKLYADNIALSYVDGEPITYKELKSKIEEIQKQLAGLGIQKGDKVAILSRNMPNWGIAFYSIISMGAIAVPLLPDFHEDEIKNILTHSETKAIFVSQLMLPKIDTKQIESLESVLVIDDLTTHIAGSQEAVEINADVEEDDLLSIIYTSGTTGKSKGVMLSHKNIVSNAINTLSIEAVNSTHKFLSILPLSHTYENTLGLILPIMQGSAIYYLDKPPTASALLPAMESVKPTHMLSVPLVIEKIYRLKILPTFNASKVLKTLYGIPFFRKVLNKAAGKKLYKSFGGQLVFFGIGGAKLDGEVEKFLKEARFPYAIGYGLTETSPLLAGVNPTKTRHQSTGPVMVGVDIKINNPDANTGEGEIWAKGDNVMKGYYKEPELTKDVITDDGWFKTGDLGLFDKDRFLYIKGRLKNMIVGASGENIYPEEIESVINNFQFVLESVVIQKKGKLVALVHFNLEELEKQFQDLKEDAVQYVKDKIEELSDELHQYVNSKVNKFSQLQAVVVHATPFEKTATQKIKRYLYFDK